LTIMIYTKKEIRYDEDYRELVTNNRFLFTEKDAICEQVAELITDRLHAEEPHTWNCAGGEYLVEPTYAKACMWMNILASKDMKRLIHVFDESKDYILGNLPSMPHKWIRYVDENGDKQVICHDYDSICSTEFGGKEQQDAHKELPYWETVIDNLPTILKESKLRTIDAHFQWNDTDHFGGYIHNIHIISNGLTISDFNTDKFKAVNKTIRTYESEEHEKEWERYRASKQYEKDRQEEAERMAELQTAMLEGGYTSYADNGDGTYSMWR
jgi:hypothetical protein